MELHWHHPEIFREADRVAAEKRVADLALDRTDLIDVRITARPTGHHRHGGQEVRITCEARGAEIVAARTRPDAGHALDEALDAFEREVRRMRHRRAERGRDRAAGPAERGVIDEVRASEGFGFILTDGGERVYFHRNALHGGLAIDRLDEGQRVGLDFEKGDRGLQATVVRPPPPEPT
jgi:cold shock CspA family protein/ribosome-associated translation inhibitor RaiA